MNDVSIVFLGGTKFKSYLLLPVAQTDPGYRVCGDSVLEVQVLRRKEKPHLTAKLRLPPRRDVGELENPTNTQTLVMYHNIKNLYITYRF